ncbi:MAG: large subunit ribosomal protein L23 [Candidatus Azotimanducaceae bacterium]|jgi:large subunit ribosomal protein L23
MYNILLGAHISEKATIIADEANQFAFKVAKDATRPEIKEAVEKIYGVSVKEVTVLNVKGKVKRNMRGVSRKPSWKKAYVRLDDGHDIDFASAAE